MMLVQLVLLCVVCSALLLGGCAQTGALTGGDADTTSPTVVRTIPAHRATNVRPSTIRIAFADYVDRSVRTALRIQPDVRFSVNYAGDEIDVELREPLADSTTYIVTLGTQFTSRFGASPKEGYTLVFSTGSNIDTGAITGKVVAANLAGFEIFCLPVVADTVVNVRLVSAPYRLAVGSSGSFRLEGLRDGEYRIAAIRDANNNGLLDADEDYATATQPVVVRRGAAMSVTLRPAAPIDSVGPYVRRVRATAARTIEVQATEPIATAHAGRFAITDSAGTRSVRADTALFARDGRDKIILRLVDSLGLGTFRMSIADSAFFDEANNPNTDTLRLHTFTGSNKADTMFFRPPPDSTTKAPRDAGSIVGVFTDSSARSPHYLLRLIDSKGAPIRAVAVQHGAAVRFDSVPPGDYRVDVVLDHNGNGRYDAGNVFPWIHAEDILDLAVAIQVRPRWAQEGVRFDVPSSPSD